MDLEDPSRERYDYLVIGSGPAGFASAMRASQLGLKVAVVQQGKDMLGGACMDEGVIPAKSLINSAKVWNTLRKHSDLFKLVVPNRLSMCDLVEHSRSVIAQLRRGMAGLFKRSGIDYITGHAQFVDQSTVRITGEDGDQSTRIAERFLIATGSVPKTLASIPFDGHNVISSSEAVRLQEAPRRILIVGGGSIGVEFASFFHALGTDVCIVEFEDSLLPTEDTDVSKGLESFFKRQGVTVCTSSKVEDLSREPEGLRATIRTGDRVLDHDCDVVLVSVGRTPLSSSLGLERVGVKTDEKGYIPVGPDMRTNVEHIYAAGDVIPTPMLANVAFVEGEIAASAAAGQAPDPIQYDAVPNVVYTELQVASLGLTEERVIAEGHDYRVGKQMFAPNFRSAIASEREGFVKVIAESGSGALLGVHIMAHEAAELIQGFTIAKRAGLTVHDIEKSILPNPTYSETVVDSCKSVFGHTMRG